MRYRPLGDSDLKVSEICLGTMTFGEQNSEREAHQQLDCALAHGVNFIDAAEMYPVQGRPETQGRTEAIVGSWLKGRARDKVIVATKVTGPARGFDWIRGGPLHLDRANIEQALNGSLERLQTDYVDLYQIHWPDRNVPMFGQTAYDPARERPTVPIEEQLAVLADLVRAGKIRYVGVSNETPWGLGRFLRAAETLGLPRVVSLQSAYNLINRVFELGLAEMCHRENVSLLAYSPLGFGLLTGKYLDAAPEQARLSVFPAFGGRYRKPNVEQAVAAYCALARSRNLSPAAMALAFVRSRWFVAGTIIGATSLAQLEENLGSVELELSEEVLREIDAIHARFPSPAP